MITERDMPEAEMTARILQGVQCGECGTFLSKAWGGAYKINGYILKCNKDIEHSTIRAVRKKSPDELEKEKEWNERWRIGINVLDHLKKH